jgi:acyl-CoA thioester hydrolase
MIEEGCEFVIARVVLDFLGEVRWPGEVTIASGVRKLGSSSVTLEQAIFQNGACVARAETIIVQINQTTHKSQALGERARAKLERLSLA